MDHTSPKRCLYLGRRAPKKVAKNEICLFNFINSQSTPKFSNLSLLLCQLLVYMLRPTAHSMRSIQLQDQWWLLTNGLFYCKSVN